MKNLVAFLLMILFLLSSCKEAIIVGAALAGAESYEEVDEETLTLRGDIEWRLEGESVVLVLEDENKILTYSADVGMSLRDADSYMAKWTWNDYFETENNLAFALAKENTFVTKDYILFYSTVRYYCIDRKTGETIWKKMVSTEDRMKDKRITGIGNLFFQIKKIGEREGCAIGENQDAIYMGSINADFQMQSVLVPEFQNEFRDWSSSLGKIGDIEAYSDNGNILLAITYAEPIAEGSSTYNNYLGVWNYTTKEWIYKDVFIEQANVIGYLEKMQDKIYWHTFMQLNCYDIANGTLLWANDEDVQDYRIFKNGHILCDFSNRQELVDAETGELKFVSPSAHVRRMGFSSKHVYLINNVLEIYDIESEKLIRTIEYPYTDHPHENIHPDSDYFKGCVRIDVIQNESDLVFININDYLFHLKINN